MARIRTIKPEFFTSADIVSMSPLARLLYIGLWCEADREGRLRWNDTTIQLRYLPADRDADIAALREELVAQNLIEIYQVDGKQYAYVRNFKKHQVINNRERPSDLPGPSDACPTREARVAVCESDGYGDASPTPFDASGTRASRVKAEGKGTGKGREQGTGKGIEVGGADAQPEYAFVGEVVRLTWKDFHRWEESYPHVALRAELQAADDYYHENPPKGGKWFFAVSNWLKRAEADAAEKSRPKSKAEIEEEIFPASIYGGAV